MDNSIYTYDNEYIDISKLKKQKRKKIASFFKKHIKELAYQIELIAAVLAIITYLKADVRNIVDSAIEKNNLKYGIDGTVTLSDVVARLDVMDEKLNNIDRRLESLENKDVDLGSHIDELYAIVNASVNVNVYHAGSGFAQTLSSVATKSRLDMSNVAQDEIIAEDKFGNAVTAKELENIENVYTYEVAGTQNLFYGRYNAAGHWDGRCVINSYKDGFLSVVTDAFYKDGKITGYEQIFSTELSGEKVWTFAKTNVMSNGENIEESKSYIREKDVPMQFSLHDASVKDIVFVSNVKEYFGRQLSFYSGLSVHGSPMDSSGDAFWIKFDEYGKIVVLQNGVFVNGGLCDSANNGSFEIVLDDSVMPNRYFVCYGPFNNGNHTSGAKCDYVTNETIDELVKTIDYNFTDLWYTNEVL